MKTLEQRIEEIGEWYKDFSRSIFSIDDAKRLKTTNQDWFDDKDECVKHANIDFRVAAPEMVRIIQELKVRLAEMTKCRDNALEMPNKLAQENIKLTEDINLAINALRVYAKSKESDLAKKTLTKLNSSL